jgi:hypothetical protein
MLLRVCGCLIVVTKPAVFDKKPCAATFKEHDFAVEHNCGTMVFEQRSFVGYSENIYIRRLCFTARKNHKGLE